MKTGKSIVGLMLAVTVGILLTQSCSKDNTGTLTSNDLTAAQDDAYASALEQDVDNTVISNVTSLDANSYSPVGMKSTDGDGSCVNITVSHPDSTHFPKVITLDYGDGCTTIFNGDTITRKGQIVITLTNRWFVAGAQQIVTFNNFFINDVQIEGTKTITNKGLNNKNHLEMEFQLENGKITFNDTAYITRNADHIWEWIRSWNPLTDTISITGSANGINVKGQNYERLITSPLILVHCPEYHWRWVIVAGTVQITNSETGVTTLDYSSSGCDGTVVINKNGIRHNYQFLFRKHNHWRHF
jgi:hypothetical protein